MKEICLLNDAFPPIIDGVANTVVNYAKIIHESGNPVSVITPSVKGADDSKYPYPVVRYQGVELSSFYGYSAGNPIPISTLTEYSFHEVDILHCHCPIVSCLVARELREVVDAPIILTYHTKFDHDIENTVRGTIPQEIAIRALVDNVSACDEVWAVSRGAGENIRSLGYQGDYVVMPNGVDIPRQRAEETLINETTKGYELPNDVPVFIFVGRLMWYKGIKIIVDALAALNSQNIEFRMVFVGGGADENEIKAYVSKNNLSNKIIFTGPIKDRKKLAAWYTRSDLFLFPSTFDTNGLVVREAAACGLGSVLVKGSCAAEGVTDGTNALLIDENAASLAVCLARVADRKDYLRQVGENASEQLYLGWEDAVKMAMERYQIVSENHKAGKYNKKRIIPDDIFSLAGEIVKVNNKIVTTLMQA